MADFTVRGAITIALEGNGAQQGVQAVEGIAKAAKGAAVELAGTSQSADALADVLEQKLGAGVGEEAVESTDRLADAIDELASEAQSDGSRVEEAFQRIEATLDHMGEDAPAKLQQVQRFTQSIAEAGGPIQSQTVPAFERFLAVTGDTKAALAATELSVTLAKKGEIEYGAAVEATTKLVDQSIPKKQQLIQAAQALGIVTKTATGEAKAEDVVLAELQKRYGDVAREAEFARNRVDRFAKTSTEAAKAAADAGKATAKLGQDAQAAAIGTTSLFGSIKGLLGAFGIVVGVQQAFSFLKGAVLDAAAVGRGFNAIGLVIRNLGIESGNALPRIREALQALALEGGAKLADSIPIYQRFLGITKDVNGALYLTKLASNAAETGFITVGAAADALGGILQGRPAQGAKALGIQLRDHNGVVRDAVALLKQAEIQYGNTGDALDDTQESIERATAKWQKFTLTIGQGLTVAGATALDFFDEIGAKLDAMERRAAGLVSRLFGLPPLKGEPPSSQPPAPPEPRNFTPATPPPPEFALDRSEAKQAGEDWQTSYEDGRATVVEQAAAAANRERVAAERATAIETLQARIQAEDELSPRRLANELRLLELQKAQAIDAAQDTGESVEQIEASFRVRATALNEEHARKLTSARIAFEEQARDQALQAEIAATAEGSDRRLALELQSLEIQRAAKLREAERLKVGRLEVERAYDREREALEAQHAARKAAAAADAEQQLLDQQLALAAEGSQERLELELQAIDRQYAAAFELARNNEEALTTLRLSQALERNRKILDAERARIDEEFRLRSEAGAGDADEIRSEQELALAEAEGNQRRIFEIQKQAITDETALKIDEADRELEHRLRIIDLDLQAHLARMQQIREEIKAQAELRAIREGREGLSVDEKLELQLKANTDLLLAEEQAEGQREQAQKQHRQSTRTAKNNEAAADKALETATTKFKIQQSLTVAQAVVTGLTAVFGQKKAFAVAEAIIHTARSIMEAAPNIPLMALMAATGALQIRTILSANPGGGGGEPTAGASGGGGQQGQSQRPPLQSFTQGPGGRSQTQPEEVAVFASGGEVPPPSDRVRALLTPGEKVLRPRVDGETVEQRLADGIAQELTLRSAISIASSPRVQGGGVDIGATLTAGVEQASTSPFAIPTTQADPRMLSVIEDAAAAIRGVRDAMASMPIDERPVINVHGSIYGGDAGLQELEYRLQRAAVLNGARRLR